MPHIILFLFSWLLLFVTVKRKRIAQFSIVGMIGGILAGTVDNISYNLGLYRYDQIVLHIVEGIPLFHPLSMFAVSIVFLDRLPKQWNKRFGYTAYFSAIIFAVEVLMYQNSAIVYMKWKLWYSYFLDIAGLSILAFLNDKIAVRKRKDFANR